MPKKKSSSKGHCSKGKSLHGKSPNKPTVTECIVVTSDDDSTSDSDSDSHCGETNASHPSIGETYLCVCVCVCVRMCVCAPPFHPSDHPSLFVHIACMRMCVILTLIKSLKMVFSLYYDDGNYQAPKLQRQLLSLIQGFF